MGADAAGKGWGPAAHMPALRGIEQIELAALCTSRPESAEAAGRAYGIRAFHDIDELVAQPDIDIISTVVRIPNHHDVVMTALRAGKHVYCEWPLGASLEEAREMATLARESGVVTAIGLQGRFEPTLAYVKELRDSGWLGDLLSVDMTMLTKGTPERPSRQHYEREVRKGAHLFNVVGGHTVDQVKFCFGSLAHLNARVATRTKTLRMADTGEAVDAETPDTVLLTGEFTDGGLLTYRIATVPFHASGWRLEVHGSEGTLVATTRGLPQITPVSLVGARGDEALRDMPVPERLRVAPNGVPPGPALNVARAYAHMADAIRQRTPFRPGFEDALHVHELLEAMQRSSDTGRTVDLGPHHGP